MDIPCIHSVFPSIRDDPEWHKPVGLGSTEHEIADLWFFYLCIHILALILNHANNLPYFLLVHHEPQAFKLV